MLIRDGDVAPAIAAAHGGIADVDLLMGIGGTPEGVIAAAAIKCLGGALQGRLWPRDDDEQQRLVDAGYDVDRVLTTDDLVAGEDVFVAATGVTSARCSAASATRSDGVITESMVMRSRSGTVRRIEAEHAFEKLVPRCPASTTARRDSRSPSPARRRPSARRCSASRGGRYARWPASTFAARRPRLQRRRLQRAAVRERELPRVRAARVHRVQVRGRVLVATGRRRGRRSRAPPRARGGRRRRASARRPRRRRRGPTPS